MRMDEDAFAEYATQLEQEDFESSLYRLCNSLKQLVDARKDTIEKLLASADYLDSLWLRCKVSRTVGTSVSVLGGGLTIAGGVLTAMTAGAASPILIAGIATSSVGTAANVGTSLVEKIINSKQIKEMNAALERDREISNKLDDQLDEVDHLKESRNLSELMLFAKKLLGDNHLLLVILNSVLVPPLIIPDLAGSDPDIQSDDLNSINRHTLLKQTSVDGLQHSVLGPGVIAEGSKVLGQNSFRAAGQVVIGFSAAFLAWDALDLGMNISDLVRMPGSQAAKVLRGKAAVLENALQNTLGVYSVKLPE